jgi:hypothetical protein
MYKKGLGRLRAKKDEEKDDGSGGKKVQAVSTRV